MEQFVKFRFVNGDEATAGLVISLEVWTTATVTELSRMFPAGEALKMQTLQCSRVFDTWKEAFCHRFD